MNNKSDTMQCTKYMLTTSRLITVSPEILSGMPVFKGTRVPVKTFFDHIEAGDSLDIFLDDFPSVSRETALAMLNDTVVHHFS